MTSHPAHTYSGRSIRAVACWCNGVDPGARPTCWAPTAIGRVIPMETLAILTAADRCDRCGAQAYVQVEHDTATLMLCAHHQREHGDALFAEGWVLVVDERRG